jgi:hypothetical protein
VYLFQEDETEKGSSSSPANSRSAHKGLATAFRPSAYPPFDDLARYSNASNDRWLAPNRLQNEAKRPQCIPVTKDEKKPK